MKYTLINSKTGEKTLCEKVVVDGFDYYVSDEIQLGTNNVWVATKSRVFKFELHMAVIKSNMPRMVIATNNPNLDIPKVLDLIEILIEHHCRKEGLSWENDYAKESLILGYNKSQETHPYSKEDMVDFLDWCSSKYQPFMDRFILSSGNGDFEDPYTTEQPWFTLEELFQLWKEQRPKKVYYE